uniref:beta-N-acetylhexosaminidase n=1 Tax=Paramormyrops kingsleyae TaxID=1676925 RepID=A0A3B3QEC1_9TELE|nr:hexosaminidase D [Paramormyrops kingsleyae]XP_023692616.1 hexosaminidase D [Paramormyrops kingsleyae]
MSVPPWSSGKKLVHLDLKGAPPRIAYLQKLIPLFAQLGAHGLLLEYEDMFPYEGTLEVLRATSHSPYSRAEIQSIQDAARSSGLEVIPLVQTFGHLEFVLKHQQFWDLREVGYCLGTLNPNKPQSLQLVLEMVRQVLELHPDSRYLHIGADEVYLLGQGEGSKQWLSVPGRDTHGLFLGHVTEVVKNIHATWPQLKLIMWDDMLRGMSHDILKDSGLVGVVQLMLWDYSPFLDAENTVRLLEKYGSAGLSQVWAASSFKGSTEVSTCLTCTQRHVDNHLQWLKVTAALPGGIELQGIAITGWQRYDHLSVLCELLPVGLPSLAACLQTLRHGSFGKEAQSSATETLGITTTEVTLITSSPPGGTPTYPGFKLAGLVVELTALLQSEELRFPANNMFVKGWFTPYHKQRRLANPLIVQQIQQQATLLLASVEQKVQALWMEMTQLFPEATAEEWVQQHVSVLLEPIRSLLQDTQAIIQEMLPDHTRLPPVGQEARDGE